jgi:hypothetical protein
MSISCTPWNAWCASRCRRRRWRRGAGFGDDALEREVARAVEDVGELLDLAARQRLELADDPAGRADRVGDVAEDELAPA